MTVCSQCDSWRPEKDEMRRVLDHDFLKDVERKGGFPMVGVKWRLPRYHPGTYFTKTVPVRIDGYQFGKCKIWSHVGTWNVYPSQLFIEEKGENDEKED